MLLWPLRTVFGATTLRTAAKKVRKTSVVLFRVVLKIGIFACANATFLTEVIKQLTPSAGFF